MAIRAITFDFWRTLFWDPVSKERFRLRAEIIARAADLPLEDAKIVMKGISSRFMEHHIEKQQTLAPRDAVEMIAQALKREFAKDEAKTLAEELAEAILMHPPEPVDGAAEAVRAAAERVPVGIVSDAGLSPGTHLRKLLDRHDMLAPFGGFAFSDEVGVAKPQAAMFHCAARAINVPPHEILHIGDLEPTDIAGARAVGATAALFTGDNDKYFEATAAHYTFSSWGEFVDALPDLLQ